MRKIALSYFIAFLCACSSLPKPGAAPASAQETLKQYLAALYSRDFKAAYPLLSQKDRALKSLGAYLQENESFDGAGLEIAGELLKQSRYLSISAADEAGSFLTLRVKARFPDGNSEAVQSLLFPGADATDDLSARLDRLGRLVSENSLPMLTIEDSFRLVMENGEGGAWKIFLNLAQAVRVSFKSAVLEGLPWRFEAPTEPVLAKPGETLLVRYKAKNLSSRPSVGKARHVIHPLEHQKHLTIIQCFCFLREELGPGEEKELPVSFRVNWKAPPEARTFDVLYEFYPEDKFKKEWEEGPAPAPSAAQGIADTTEEKRVVAKAGTGLVQIFLTDHREAIDDFQSLALELGAVSVHPKSAEASAGWIQLPLVQNDLDLTRYVGGKSLLIAKGEAPAQAYDAVNLSINLAKGLLKRGGSPKISWHLDPVRSALELKAGQSAALTIDLVVQDVSEHPGQGYAIYIRALHER